MIHLPTTGSSVPYGYSLVPNNYAPNNYVPNNYVSNNVVPQHRLMMVQPGIRTRYSVLDPDDDEVDDYVPIRPKKRSSDLINELSDSSEMEEFSAQTREIRKNADAVLTRLNASKPVSRASDFFKSYDYDTRPLVMRKPSPIPERYSTRSPYPEDDEDIEDRVSWRFRGLYPSSLRQCGISSVSLTKDRIRSVYADLDEPASYRTPKSYDFSHPDFSTLRTPIGAVQSEVNRKAMIREPAIGRSTSLRTPRDKIHQDASDVRSNISIRAHYASMRDAATRDVAMRRPKDTMP
jgi:hypothetical protein